MASGEGARATKVVTAFASESTYSSRNQETQIEDEEDESLVLDSWSSQWDDWEQVEDK